MTAPLRPESPTASATRIRGIVCGTDFSEEAGLAAEAAAAIAGKLGDPLILTYATEALVPGSSGEQFAQEMIAARRRDLEKQA